MDMDMSTSTANSMSMATSTSMAMTSSTSMAMSMSMQSMDMVFYTSTSTPLWSSAFTPSTTGQYAGACIFLIAFTVIFRALIAFRINFFKITAAAKQKRSGSLLPPTMIEEKVQIRLWRADEAVTVGVIDMVIVGVSYLLMLAVMTMNVGYFLSILGGAFLGSMLFNRFTGSTWAH
ncbi:hypothetical protein N7520_009647 [Penicillium odoratum]|uniref:uncharacterized protein n=1 Tax=Penicillium odoratum TaxID=1167516 RepID=UPI002547FC2E|nr:uncharacterized protein N7520_009647 [Penicillium odoratum]KAJ5752730.1 hypothetical protein N7520_009647 [Penicillium odoratum]